MRRQMVLEHSIELDPRPASTSLHTDYFGNEVMFVTVEGAHRQLRVTARNRLELWSLHAPRERFVAGYAGGYFATGLTRGQDPPPVELVPRPREGAEIAIEST